jgi:MbtH protein
VSDLDDVVHLVVVNDEDQYSIWRADRPLPAGWRGDGFTGGRDECLEHIEEVWTDMRPRSVRLLAENGQ